MRRQLILKLWNDRRAAVRGFFRRRASSRKDAADLTQEVYLRILRTSDAREIHDPEAYLFTVARNLLTEHAIGERKNAERDLLGALAPDVGFEPAYESQVDHAAQVQLLREAIAQLNAAQRAALVMAYQHDMSYAQIASRLNVHRSMVGKYVLQALDHCRRHLASRGTP
jgi:RNA polymerase sigma factor (sigma-70 family)